MRTSLSNGYAATATKPHAPLDVAAELTPRAGAYRPAREHESGIQANVRTGVDRILSRFLGGGAVVRGRCVLDADGTGSGKGNTLLEAAAALAKSSHQPALLVTSDELVAELRADNRNPARVHVIGYTAFSDNHTHWRNQGPFCMVGFDEAHMLSRLHREAAVRDFPAEHRLYATATPGETLRSTVFFLSELAQRSEGQICEQLGLHDDAVPGDGPVVLPADFFARLRRVYDDLYAQGALFKRDYPFYGEVTHPTVRLPDSFLEDQVQVAAHYSELIEAAEEAGERDSIRRLADHATEELRLLTEEAKLPAALDMIRSALYAGRRVLVYGSEQPFYSEALQRDLVPAQVVLPEWLAAEGISFAQVKAHPAGLSPQDRDRLNEQAIAAFVGHVRKVNGVPTLDRAAPPAQVLLLPDAFSAGFGNLIQKAANDGERTLISLSYPSLGDLIQQLGRVSRKKSVGPSEVMIPSADNSLYDQTFLPERSGVERLLLMANRTMWLPLVAPPAPDRALTLDALLPAQEPEPELTP